ncbi:MAG: hypothetical protein N3F07_01555 [Candidatus Micrarchaeota archaeon]|nr:hypothetical protein [Candidatus Micrarchaeota archaeon]
MDVLLRRSIVSGKFKPPPSPAAAHRALAACSLAYGQSVIANLPETQDVQATVSACNSFGADILVQNGVADIFGAMELDFPPILDCQQSNTTLKLMLPLACLSGKKVAFSGSGKLAQQLQAPFCAYLQSLGAKAECPTGCLPIEVQGPIAKSELVYFAELGSQLLSGILLASPFSPEAVEIGIEGEFYGWEHVEATKMIMEACGIRFQAFQKDFIIVEPGQDYSASTQLEVQPSLYLSSFLLLAGALLGKVEAEGRMPQEEAGRFKQILESFGAHAILHQESFSASAGSLSGASFLAPQLGEFLPHALVLSAASEGQSRFEGMAALKPRMRRRAGIIARQLSRMGAMVEESGNLLEIAGGKLKGAQLDAEGDPAAAMALCSAALFASGQSKLCGAECALESFPSFFKELSSLGAIVR